MIAALLLVLSVASTAASAATTIAISTTAHRDRPSTSSTTADADTLPWAGIVDASYTGAAGAPSPSGIPTFRSIGDALTRLPVNGATRMVIFIRNGRYREKLTVDRPRVTLRGQTRNGVVITYDATADTPSPGGGTFGTRGSYTLRIVAPDFRAEHLTIENAFDYPANAAKANDDRTKIRHPQAVALMTDLGSDRAVFDDVRILGHQDTLFTNSGRAWFHACEIVGSVDVIFGAGQSVFEECDIISRDRGSASNNGYVTAPSTDTSQQFGFLFLRSRLRKETAEMAKASVTLGRAWHPFADPRAVGSAVFIGCEMDDHIGAKGWDRMSSVDSTGTRIWYEPESARFFEHGTTGPGAIRSESRRVLSKADAAIFTRVSVLGGWNPQPLPETNAAQDREDERSSFKSRDGSGWIANQRDLESRGGVSRVEELFEGRFPGVRVLRLPGGFSIQVRGATTINGNTSPLYVIDGFAIDAGPDGLIALNPGDIQRIEVLKDAASLAYYGVRGANGVVVITTKRPKQN